MRFLHINECAEWCRDQGATINDPWSLAKDQALAAEARILFAPNGSLGLEPQVSDACLAHLGPWDECLLWITEWDIWPSSEDWPSFYQLRGSQGEIASLWHKPGHLFVSADTTLLAEFLAIVLKNGWDAHLLPSSGAEISRRLFVSHDGWVSLATPAPTEFRLPAS
jgi:hypothetical protein